MTQKEQEAYWSKRTQFLTGKKREDEKMRIENREREADTWAAVGATKPPPLPVGGPPGGAEQGIVLTRVSLPFGNIFALVAQVMVSVLLISLVLWVVFGLMMGAACNAIFS